MKRFLINGISVLVGLAIIFVLILGFIIASPFDQFRDPFCKFTHLNTFCRGIIDTHKMQVNNDVLSVGLSDGGFAFDLSGENTSLKQQAAQDFNDGNVQGAIDAWNQAVSMTTDDAESLIYGENGNVALSRQPHITIVVPTTLSVVPSDNSTSLRVAQDDLRGVYLAQRDFNAKHANLKLRIVLANLGVKTQVDLDQAEKGVLQQIIRLANTDDTFVGVVGFPFSAAAAIAIPILAAAHIPLISPSASSNALSDSSSLTYFFRVAPPDAVQGQDAAQFAAKLLGARRVAVFSDSIDSFGHQSNSYSKSLAASFTSSFTALGSDHVVIPESFHLGFADTLDKPLSDVLGQNPPVDMIFLAGYSDDLNNLKDKLVQNNAPSLPVMGGDAFYELGGYGKGNYTSVYFTSFAYHSTWDALCTTSCASPDPAVTNLKCGNASEKCYSDTFDPQHVHKDYGYDLPGPHVMLSYDAIDALLQAVDAVEAGGASLTRENIRDALQSVSFQGVTGEISFSGSDPVNKTVLMLCIDSHHHTQLVRVYGQFAPGSSNLQFDIASRCG